MKCKTFKVVNKSEAYRVTGKGPISTKWVDTDKNSSFKANKIERTFSVRRPRWNSSGM